MKKLVKTSTLYTLFLLFMLQAFNVSAGIKLLGEVHWNTAPREAMLSNGLQVTTPDFKGATFNESFSTLPVVIETLPLTGNVKADVVLGNASYAMADPFQFKGADAPKNEVQLSYQIVYQKKQPTLVIYMVPFRTNPLTGQVEKLMDYTLDITLTPNTSAKTSSNTYAAHSVLQNGNWYKMGVTTTGIHKIDYNLLTDLGIDPASIDPRNIHIYGNGGGMLPEANSASRPDDLVENPILVVGESDGHFDQGDYILFYAQGPSLWSYDSNEGIFKYNMNVYSNQNYYFITANNTAGLRVGSNPSSGTANQTVTAFDDYANHESDAENLIASGKKWYGDYYNFGVTSRSFNFNFPNLVTSEPVTIRTEVAARSTISSTSMPVTVNGQQLYSHNMAAVSTSYTAIYANNSVLTDTYNANSSQLNLTIGFNNASSSSEGWLSFIEINARRSLTYSSGELQFRDTRSVGSGNVSEFVIQGGDANVSIWDVTDPTQVVSQQFTASGGQMRFTTATDALHQFVAFRSNGSFAKPTAAGAVANQDLHGIGQPDMVIITTSELMSQAQRLADFHNSTDGLDVAVVDIAQIYNEFSSGRMDVTAVRDFLKMLYDNAGSDVNALPQYCLLFGDASYDFRNIIGNNSNQIPTYESDESLSPVSSFCSDDYFGFLDDNEGSAISSVQQSLDIAIGRIPVKNTTEASQMVDKIMHYSTTATLGNWRNNITFIGDDEDNNLHLNDANDLADDIIKQNFPVYNVKKIFLDAYKEQSTPAGSRYPDVKDEINRSIFQGTLLMDYVGHGGTNGWAHERIIDLTDIRNWNNYNKLPLFVTATCEFTRHDDPDKVSAGEEVMLNPTGGAIGLVTTVRLVYASANKETNQKFLTDAFSLYNGTRMPTIGEAVMEAKNDITSGALNARKFTLIGDPALTLAYPKFNVVTTSINGDSINVSTDTLSALEEITICGEVQDANGVVMTGFNGYVYPTIFDKELDVQTLANDPQSYKETFKSLSSIIFKGKATVVNGTFCFSFIVPKDISYNFGTGKISYYADNGTIDANGYEFNFVIGGTARGFDPDADGPDLQVFMNDENFQFGGITDANPILYVKLHDLHGINTAGNGVGHDLTAVLDDNTSETYVLNDYYESDADNYSSGKVLFPLANLESGLHRIKVKAWDVYNNSAEGYTEFVVSSSPKLALEHVLNYPNPFAGSTNFSFEHNKPGEQLFVEVVIYNMVGQKVKTIKAEVQPEGYRVNDIGWDGTNDKGAPITKGVYLYRLQVSTASGETDSEVERLVIIK